MENVHTNTQPVGRSEAHSAGTDTPPRSSILLSDWSRNLFINDRPIRGLGRSKKFRAECASDLSKRIYTLHISFLLPTYSTVGILIVQCYPSCTVQARLRCCREPKSGGHQGKPFDQRVAQEGGGALLWTLWTESGRRRCVIVDIVD